MAVLQRVNTPLANREAELIQRLLTEWQQSEQVEPVIIEEAPAADQPPNHLYVVWTEWTDLSPLERSRIIMQAYEQKLGGNAARVAEVTVAMGLTPEEARRMGIEI